MDTSSHAVGLSARQKINTHFSKFFWVLAVLLTVLLASVVSSSGQMKKAPPKNSNEPKIDIKVNRHYDDHGNIIGYDSTYSSSYSSVQGDTIGMRRIMKDFDEHFSSLHPWRFDRHFEKIFSNDTSMFSPHFFGNDFFLNEDDYFQRRYKFSDNFFRDMMQELDSIKNKFHPSSRRELKRL